MGSIGAMGGGLKGLLAQAQRAAQKRAQKPSTAHVVLVMLQSGTETGPVLSGRGMREGDLLSALKVVDEEPASALEVAVERAAKLATALDEPVRPLHLLLVIVRDARTAGYRCIEQIGASPARLREEIAALLGTRAEETGRPKSSGRRVGSAPPSRSKPRARGHRPIAARPLTPPKPRPNRRVEEETAAAPLLSVKEVERPRPEPSGPSAASPRPEPAPPAAAQPQTQAPTAAVDAAPQALLLDEESFPVLSAIGRNLSALAAEGKIDPVIGRDPEIEQLLDVLARRRANNPVLVGAPGVGKTAIVEGLALRLAEGGEGVNGLEGRVVVEVSAGALVSGTGVRGALAERMRQLREEVARSEGRVLLFIDEIHAVVGGGDGPDDLANELKSALARGELPCIGATTDAEYRRHFERDPALVRRFSAVRVQEPSPEDALRIVRGVVGRYERHHVVAYANDALRASVDLSVRYVLERQLPDKAIAVLDLAGARVRRRGGTVVDVEAVAGVISEQAGVPLERLLVRDADRLLELERHLGERVVGHEGCVARIADVLRKGAAGLRGARPLGTFLLLGPTGVGKTEMAKAVADVLFPAGAMTRLDMSEMSEAHAVARLVGAPPGYVGHEEGGQLTEAVRRRPYQLLLLDEIDKAHPEVLLSLLPLLDEGRLTDARGRTVDFTHTVVFLTTNLGADPSAAPSRIGFGGDSSASGPGDARAVRSLASARAALPPELWNRIDEPLYFAPLSPGEVEEIARRMLASLGETLARERAVTLRVEPSAVSALVAAGGYDPALGARPMRRTIGRLVEAPLAAAILAGDVGASDQVVLRGEEDRVVLDLGHRADAAE